MAVIVLQVYVFVAVQPFVTLARLALRAHGAVKTIWQSTIGCYNMHKKNSKKTKQYSMLRMVCYGMIAVMQLGIVGRMRYTPRQEYTQQPWQTFQELYGSSMGGVFHDLFGWPYGPTTWTERLNHAIRHDQESPSPDYDANALAHVTIKNASIHSLYYWVATDVCSQASSQKPSKLQRIFPACGRPASLEPDQATSFQFNSDIALVVSSIDWDQANGKSLLYALQYGAIKVLFLETAASTPVAADERIAVLSGANWRLALFSHGAGRILHIDPNSPYVRGERLAGSEDPHTLQQAITNAAVMLEPELRATTVQSMRQRLVTLCKEHAKPGWLLNLAALARQNACELKGGRLYIDTILSKIVDAIMPTWQESPAEAYVVDARHERLE